MDKGTGKMFVKTDGKIFYFCSRRCEKNMFKLKRKPRKTKWTLEYQNEKKGANAQAKPQVKK